MPSARIPCPKIPSLTSSSERKERYLQLYDFLLSYKDIWSIEVIHEPSITLTKYPEQWVKFIEKLSDEELFKLSTPQGAWDEIPGNFYSFLNTIKRLTDIPLFDNEKSAPPFPLPAYQNLTPKKKYELERIFNHLLTNTHLPYKNSVIDFCGGAGYIARTLAHYCNTPSISLDIDCALQKRGKEKHKRFVPPAAKDITFIPLDLLSDYTTIKKELPHHSPIIGVHTCGHLSDIQLSLSRDLESPWTFNVGCCYFKTDNHTYHTSTLAKAHPIPYTGYSLFLAARGHEVNLRDFKFSQRVKRYRYLLHLFLQTEFGLQFEAVGSVPESMYENDFIYYAKERLHYLLSEGIIREMPVDKTILSFQTDQSIQHKAHYMRMCNYIRSQFSRVLELTIALDRAIFLDENNFKVTMGEIFDSRISPRNIGLFGSR